MSEFLEDELCHMNKEPVTLTSFELADYKSNGEVILHNTMRFDVQLAHVGPMLQCGEVQKADIVNAIRDAIIEAVDDVLGTGLDGTPIPFGGKAEVETKSKMLHRETIMFDLS